MAFLLHVELSFLKRIEDAKETLEKTNDFSMIGLFKFIDKNTFNYIEPNALLEFAKDLGFMLSPEAIRAIYRRTNEAFNFKLTFKEFCDNICHP